MSEDRGEMKDRKAGRANTSVAMACIVFVGCMVGAAYAAVPLYELFCRVTGYGGTTQRAESSDVSPIDRTITVRFDANVGGGLPWNFKAETKTVTLRMGEVAEVAYFAENVGSSKTFASATFNVTPFDAGPYFNKLECFCFTDQDLGPGEDMTMPVVFFVDPEMDKDPNLKSVREITLSYTFFGDDDKTEKPVAAAANADGTPEKL